MTEELNNTQPPAKRKYTRKEGVALGRPKKAPNSPVGREVAPPPISTTMLEIMAILTCPDAGDEAKVAALGAYRFCKGIETCTER